jgi:hypothetical protein
MSPVCSPLIAWLADTGPRLEGPDDETIVKVLNQI